MHGVGELLRQVCPRNAASSGRSLCRVRSRKELERVDGTEASGDRRSEPGELVHVPSQSAATLDPHQSR
jgi:hypothetical protein